MADRKTACEKRHHEDDSNSETKRQKCMLVEQTSPVKDLTDLNDDCLRKIFEHLKLQDLLNVANSNKWLNAAACSVFSKNHGHKRIYLRNLANVLPMLYVWPDKLLIGSLRTCFQFMRCFGRCITKLEVNYEEISKRNCAHINQYIQMYCATSLTEISFNNAVEFPKSTKQSLPKVERVCVAGRNLGSHLSKFAKWFPQMRHLEVDWNHISRRNKKISVDASFPHLEHLRISVNNNGLADKLAKESVAALIHSNAYSLQCLKIGFLEPSVKFSEFIRMIGIQPMITKLTVLNGITSLSLDKRNVGRFVNALPYLIELDLSNFTITADAAIAYIRKFNFLKKFQFRLDGLSPRRHLHRQLHDEWQMSIELTVLSLSFVTLER